MEELHIPAGRFFRRDKDLSYPEGVQAKEFMLSRELLEEDCVISLCKMKTHAGTNYRSSKKQLWICVWVL